MKLSPFRTSSLKLFWYALWRCRLRAENRDPILPSTLSERLRLGLLPPLDAFPSHPPAHQLARREQSFWTAPAWCSSYDKCPSSIADRKALRKVKDDGSADDWAEPGFFARNLHALFLQLLSNLVDNIQLEPTSTRRTALHRYTFPPNTTNPRIPVDVTNDGQRSSTNPQCGRYNAFVCGTFKGEGYTIDAPAEYGIFLNNYPTRGTTHSEQVYIGFQPELGAVFTFPASPSISSPTSILARVGVSLISAEQACKTAEEEIPDFDFERVRNEAEGKWDELLGRVQVDVTGRDVELFYSSLYRTHIAPTDYTGENPKWESEEPYFDSLYCNWDTYQCRGATVQHYMQGGSNADPVLGEFFVKFASHAESLGVSPEDLYTALLADAEEEPPNWNVQGRQVGVWKELGYIAQDMFAPGGANTKWVSRTVEYAFNDFAIAQVAKALGKDQDVTKNFLNVWNANVTMPDEPSIKGFMQPRFADGTWNYTDPRHCSVHDPEKATCFLNAVRRDGFYESSHIVYSQYVPQDTAKLIELQGGVGAFVKRLDFIFANFESTNEPSQQMPFMYHYANRPGLSTQRARQVLAKYFNTTRNGLPGNDDSGAMGSYVAFYMVGLYPLPATRQILLSSPYFANVAFENPVFNTTTVIKAVGFEGNPADGTGGKVFVESVKVNGEPWASNCYIDWDVFEKGGVIALTLTDDINVSCGKDQLALPPSISTGGYD
ncbi:glycosyl hydrolase family 92-domain-containing protein [Ephemerocybe angulata]|uniref:Glycosyl hydrolase family 92-domain-containing protein n=1 Tax=Ephemerocybe angulata TaxID=980116 RepID=A0A8H6H7B8_9AGAR|nr:glycosyl hydrolase family 92-domain-containing protein [Tulosesus angulatus]